MGHPARSARAKNRLPLIDYARFDNSLSWNGQIRCAARIHDRHGELYPFTVEAAASLPAVRRSAFIRTGGRRTLVVEPAAASPAAELIRLKSKLGWAKIERVLVLPRIPVDRRHNAKVDYPGLDRILKRL